MNKSVLLLIAYLVVGALSVACPLLDDKKPDDAAILNELKPTSEEEAKRKKDAKKLIYTHDVAIISTKKGLARIVKHDNDEPQALHEYEIEQHIAHQDNPLVPGTPPPHHFAYSYGCWAHDIYFYTATQATGGHMDEDKERNHFLESPPAEQAATLDKMASALLALHLAGVVHCHVQPKMFGRLDGSITIFNFKKAIKQGNGFCTKDDKDHDYAAPELFKSDLSKINDMPQKIRAAADDFSFGIVLIDMIDKGKDKERPSKTLMDKSNDGKSYADTLITGVINSKFDGMIKEAEKLETPQLKAQRSFFLTQMKAVVSGLTKFNVVERATLLDMLPAIHCISAALGQAQANNLDEGKINVIFSSCKAVLESKKTSISTPRSLTEAMNGVKNEHNFLI